MNLEYIMNKFVNIRMISLTIAAVIILISLFQVPFTVSQRNVDVVTRFGKISYIAGPGLHFKIPWVDSTSEYTTATQQIKIVNDAVNSSDNQRILADLNVQFNILPSAAITIYSKYPDYETRVKTLSADILRQVMGKYDASDVPGKRGEMEQEVLLRISHEANRLYGIDVTEVQLVDIDYTTVYNDAVNAMTKAKARERQAEIDRSRASVIAQQTVIEAEARANSNKAEADGEAYSVEVRAKAEAEKVRIEGNAQAEAIKAQTEALKTSPEFVQYTVAKTWDGKLPVNIGVGASSSSIPMLNLGNLTH